jgi:glycogen debranching enzyme
MGELRRTVREESLLPEALREWLVANGLGGYASATITGAITRRYHGFLIAAQPAPLGRMVVLEVSKSILSSKTAASRICGSKLDFSILR